jgi:hypothetical protein
MELNRAISLADFINERNQRFTAKVLDFSNRGWVLVKDTGDDRYLEPIADLHDYVRRARQGQMRLDDACRNLLTEWVAEDPADRG